MKSASSHLNIRPDRLKKLLRDLVDIYSPSGKEEEVIEFSERYLKKHGLVVKKQDVDEGRFNLLVFPEGRYEVDLCFVGHLDTVTAHDLEDFGFYEEGDNIFGLGTADMKAGCAAMMETFVTLAGTKKAFPPVGLALAVGEEENSSA